MTADDKSLFSSGEPNLSEPVTHSAMPEGDALFVISHQHAIKRMLRTGLLSLPPDRDSEPGIFDSVLVPKSKENTQAELPRVNFRRGHKPIIVELTKSATNLQEVCASDGRARARAASPCATADR